MAYKPNKPKRAWHILSFGSFGALAAENSNRGFLHISEHREAILSMLAGQTKAYIRLLIKMLILICTSDLMGEKNIIS